MTQLHSKDALPPIETRNFLPPVSPWVALGSWSIVLAMGGAIAAAFSIDYRTTVRAPAVIRPAGDARLVQAAVAGTVQTVSVEENAIVKQGEAIASLKTDQLDVQAAQLAANLAQGEQRLARIDAQIVAADSQIAAESDRAERSVAALTAEYEQSRRHNQTQRISAQAAVEEARAQIALLQQEVNRYQQLVASGAISQLQLLEKQSALAAAEARVTGLKASLNPSEASIEAAQARIAQAKANGAATLAQLQQSKQSLIQQKLELQTQLRTVQKDKEQVALELQNAVVRSPISGTLYELALRNPGQVVGAGDTLAKVIPDGASITIQASVPSEEINKVEQGLPVQVKVSACPFTEFGTVRGIVSEISPDAISANRTSQPSNGVAPTASFYSVTIETDTPVLESANRQTCRLQPGTEGQATIVSKEEKIIDFVRRKIGYFTSL